MSVCDLAVIFEKAAKHKDRFFSTSLYHLPRKKQSFLHYHDVLELGLCLSGKGKCLTDKGEFPYKAGDAQVVLPYQPHYDVAEDDDTLWIFINIDVPRISSPHLSPDPAFMIELVQKCSTYGIFSSQDHADIHGIITDIVSLMQAAPTRLEHTHDLLTAKLITLLIELSQGDIRADITVERARKQQSVLPAMHCVSAALSRGERPTPRQMADACFMSESYFRKIFFSVMSEPPKSYITRMQVQKAAGLLATTDMSLTTIAAECGFEDNSTLYRCFVRIYGTAPGKYRKKK